MFHHDGQMQLGKRNSQEHPMDRILPGFFNPVKTSSTNIRTNKYRAETNHIIQRQRVIRSFLNKSDENEPSIRKPTILSTTPKSLSVTSIPSPPVLLTEINDSSTNNNNRQPTMKKDLDSQSAGLVRRQRPTIENLSPVQQMSDITDLSANQFSIPSNFTFRNKPPRILLPDRSSSLKIDEPLPSPRVKSLNHSKSTNEGPPKQTIFIPKIITQNVSHSTHTWTPKLTDQSSSPTRTLVSTLHAKSQLLKRFKIHQRRSQTDRLNQQSKTNDIQDLFISPRAVSHSHQQEYDASKKIHQTRSEWKLDDDDDEDQEERKHISLSSSIAEDSKYHPDLISDEDESISVSRNSSTSTCNSQVSIFLSTHSKAKVQRSSIKRNISRRRGYNHALSPVVEHRHDDETGDEI